MPTFVLVAKSLDVVIWVWSLEVRVLTWGNIFLLFCVYGSLNVTMVKPQFALFSLNTQIFVGDWFSWASIPTKIKPTKICTHEEFDSSNYGGLLLSTIKRTNYCDNENLYVYGRCINALYYLQLVKNCVKNVCSILSAQKFLAEKFLHGNLLH